MFRKKTLPCSAGNIATFFTISTDVFQLKKGIFRSGKTAETAYTAYTADLGTTSSLPISVF